MDVFIDSVLIFAGMIVLYAYAMATYFKIKDSFRYAKEAKMWLNVFKNRDFLVRQAEEKIASGQDLFNELEMRRDRAKYAMEEYEWYRKQCGFTYIFLWPITDSINFVKRMRSDKVETRELVATYKKYYQ